MSMDIETLSVDALHDNVDADTDSLFPWDFCADYERASCVVEIDGHHYELFAIELPGGEFAWLTRRHGVVKAGIKAIMNSALAAAEVAVAASVRPQLRVVDEDDSDE